MSATERRGGRPRGGHGRGSADSPKAQWSGGARSLPREHPWASASLDSSLLEAGQSCATGKTTWIPKPVVKADDIAGMEPERVLQVLPDDADKFRLVRVVEPLPAAFASGAHLAPPLMKLNCGSGLARNARMISTSCGRAGNSNVVLSPPAQRVSMSPRKNPALMGCTFPCCR